jgi:hypothetical protein
MFTLEEYRAKRAVALRRLAELRGDYLNKCEADHWRSHLCSLRRRAHRVGIL